MLLATDSGHVFQVTLMWTVMLSFGIGRAPLFTMLISLFFVLEFRFLVDVFPSYTISH